MLPSNTSSIGDDVYQERVSLYLKVLFCLITVLTAVSTVINGLRPEPGWLVVVLLGAGWLWAARSRPARVALLVLESAGSLALIGTLAYLVSRVPDVEARFFLLPLAALVLTLRASVVPSSASRTILVGVLAAATTVLTSQAMSPTSRSSEWIWTSTMALGFVGVTAVASQVIYGLRRAVRRANRLGQYELVRKLGEGAMGVVYEATHTLLRRRTAVKVLKSELAGEVAIERFEREVRQTSRLEHPNSVYIYDFGRTSDGQFYYAMEYLDGIDLQELVRDYGPLPDGRVAHILRQAAEALAEAHDFKLVHRDVKPANMVLCDRAGIPDSVKVLDFGLVKSLDATDVELTRANAIVGTPNCLAPEVIQSADAVGPPADIYGLGVSAYYLLTGRYLFEASSVMELCAMHLRDEPVPPSKVVGRAIDAQLEAVILRCVAKSPEERYRDGRELAAAVSDLGALDWSPAQARAWWAHYRQMAAATPVADAPAQLDIELGART